VGRARARAECGGRASYPKSTTEKVARILVEEWAKEGWQTDWQRLIPRRGFEVLPRRWVVKRTSSWLSQNRPHE
jgi:transposase